MKYISGRNFFVLIFLAINLLAVLTLFTLNMKYPSIMIYVVVLYALFVVMSLSRLGSKLMVYLAHGKELGSDNNRSRIIALWDIVYSLALREDSKLPRNLELCIVEDEMPYSYTFGRKVVLSTGLMSLPDNMIKGILSHELGHISNNDTSYPLLIGGANFVVTIVVLLLRQMTFGLHKLLDKEEGGKVTQSSTFAQWLNGFTNVLLFIWIKITNVFVMVTMRGREYKADAFARKIGYGPDLISALNFIADRKPNNLIMKALYSTNPDFYDRADRIKESGSFSYKRK